MSSPHHQQIPPASCAPGVSDTAHYASQREPQPSTSVHLEFSTEVYRAICAHGEQTYPHECCGILLGAHAEGTMMVHEALPAGNTRLDSARNRYNIEPLDLVRAQREARSRALDIIGFYHSHPDHPCFPSATDLAEAHWYGCAYVITSIDGSTGTPKAHATNSFLLTGGGEDDKAFALQPWKLREA